MHINSVQNCVATKGLIVHKNNFWDIKESTIKHCEKLLTDTKRFDIVIDSSGIAIKEKMTEILQRIQSFSLFTQENCIGINTNGIESKTYKLNFANLEEAKQAWKDLYQTAHKDKLEGYTKVALLLDKLV